MANQKNDKELFNSPLVSRMIEGEAENIAHEIAEKISQIDEENILAEVNSVITPETWEELTKELAKRATTAFISRMVDNIVREKIHEWASHVSENINTFISTEYIKTNVPKAVIEYFSEKK